MKNKRTMREEKQEKQWLTDNMKEMIKTFKHTLKQHDAKRYKDRIDTLDDQEPIMRQHIINREENG